MKGFKKLALVAAIAAPFSSVHALEALDDSVLSDMTGQSGVTIELETRVTMDSFTWIDTDGEGGVSMRGLTIGGFLGATLDDVQVTIDSQNGGDLVIALDTISGAPVDLGIDLTSVTLDSAAAGAAENITEGATIASNINLDIFLGPQEFVIENTGAGTSGLITAQGYFQLNDSSSMDLDVAGISLSSLKVGEFLGDADADAAGFRGGVYNDVAAMQANGLGAGFSYYNVTIGTADSLVAGAATDALQLTVTNFETDITADVAIGGASIGSIAMTDLTLDGTTLTVYGH